METDLLNKQTKLRYVYTCDLQWELENREGVDARALGVDDNIEVLINGQKWKSMRGPLTVTLNQD